MNVTVEDYKRAEMFLPWNLEKRVLNSVVIPYFLEKDDRFWYLRKTREGKEFIIVDVAKNTQKPLFSHERLARVLSTVLETTIAGTNLPFDELEIDEERQTIQFDVKKQGLKCDLTTYKCTRLKHPVKSPPGELRSPDGQWAAFLRDHNLFVRNMETDEELQLTFDGEPYYAYGTPSESNLQTVTDRRAGILPTPVGIWSADSNRLLTQRLDERKVGELHLLQSVPKQGYGRPILYSYRYPLPGDSVISQAELIIMDIKQQKQIPIQGDPVLASPKSVLEAFFNEGSQWAWWSDDGSRIYYIDQERGYTSLRLHAVDTSNGQTQPLISESDTTYLNPNSGRALKPNIRVLGDGAELIWFSQRDGWGHLYLYDGTTGRLKHPITTGDYLVRDIKHVDEQRRQIYFTATGREPGRDAYFRHLYRASLDGESPELLTPEDADHWVRFSPNGHYFVDTYTWGSDVPTTVLRDAQGKLIP